MGPGGGSALTSCSRCGDVSRSLELSCLCVSSPLSPLLLPRPPPAPPSQEVGLKGSPERRSIPPPQYYSQLISEMETLGWDK